MVKILSGYQEELDEAGAYQAVRYRADATAAQLSPGQLAELERRYQRNPQLPADVHLAVASSPGVSDEQMDQLALQYADMGIEPMFGDTLTGNQLRYMLASDEDAARIDNSVAAVIGAYRPESLAERMMNLAMGTGQRIDQAFNAARPVGNALSTASNVAGYAQPALRPIGSSVQAAGGFANAARSTVKAAGATQVGGAAYAGLKGFSRNAMPALDFPQQAFQAGGRYLTAGVVDARRGDYVGALENVGQVGRGFDGILDQTDWGQMLQERFNQGAGVGRMLLGNDYELNNDIGNGFFANQDSAMVRRRQEAERQMGTLPNGQTYTLGRTIATGWGFEPEGIAYNVTSGLLDGAVTIGAPGVEGGAARALGSGRRGLQSALGGLSEDSFIAFDGLNQFVDVPAARAWLHSERSQGLVDYMVGRDGARGFGDIWRATRGSLDPYTVTRLSEAQTPEAVREILGAAIQAGAEPVFRNTLGRGVSEATGWLGDTAFFRQSGLRRLRGLTPDSSINLRDGQSAVGTVYEFARNVKATDEVADGWAFAMGSASNEFERYSAFTQMLGETAEMLSEGGLPQGSAQRLSRFLEYEMETTRASMDDMLTMGPREWDAMMAGEFDGRILPIHLMSQAATELPMPDFRNLRRATSWARPLWEATEGASWSRKIIEDYVGPTWRGTFDGLMWMQTKWKMARLARIGYPIRTWMTEEYARMVVDGQTGFSHPGGVFAAMLDKGIRTGDDLDDLIRQARMLDGMDDLTDVQAFELAMIRDDLKAGRGVRDITDGSDLRRSDEAMTAAMDERLGGAVNERATGRASGPLQRFERDGKNPDTFRAVWRQGLMELGADEVASRVARHGVDETFDYLIGDGAKMWRKLQSMSSELADPMNLRRYLDNVVANKIEALTGGNDDLLQVVRRGRWNDGIDLASLTDEGVAPSVVVGRGVLDDQQTNSLTDFVNRFFEVVQTQPSSRFRRIPVFMNEYERGLVRLAPLAADPDAYIEAARRANVTPESLETIIRVAKGEGTLPLEQIDALVKKKALDHVQSLLFDVTRQSQFFDQMRLIAPFGEAWREVVTTWSKLATQDPFIMQRFAGQAGRALASEDTGGTYFDLVGQGDREDSGFFYTNEYGERVFYFPFSREFSQFMTSRGRVDVPALPFSVTNPFSNNGTGGVPIDMEGSLSGLNVAGEIFPSLGPFSGILANEIIPNDTSWDPVREQVFPFGVPPSMQNLANFLPSWMATAMKGSEQMTPDQMRVYGNTRLRVMRYLMSTGDYQGPEGYDRLLADSDEITPLTFFVRGVVQFTAPTSPQLSFNMIGPNGELADQAAAADRYRRLREEDPSTALERFLAEWGEGALLATQGGTTSVYPGGTPLEGAGYDWVRDNPSVETDHRELHGFFAPLGEGSPFSQEAYLRSIERGDREVLSSEEQLMLANHRRANSIYRQYSDVVPASQRSDEQRAFLNQLRLDLMQDYPGYDRVDGIGGSPRAYELIDAGLVDEALNDPVLLSTPTGAALAEYWTFRSQVLSQAEAEGVTVGSAQGWRTTQSGEQYRGVLRAAGEELVRQEPEFARMWDLFLSQEFAREAEDE